ncbi:fimbrial protein, type IV pilin, PilE [Legionella spiritensis]|uniref:Fimbrial protein, type IV pilin, PilE n=2 Tax=Legionella spiritensis TaxID=452 RepID=A0A0W0YW37_LEGSP|nr:fimbrial protein, type IV pilin, PilE [Legionella spiritensis]SNV44765.1 fimbrial protein, type IV pilin, PilE [Legionella spiritensis]
MSSSTQKTRSGQFLQTVNREVGSRIRYLGFTMLELMLVAGILGVAAIIAIPSYNRYLDRINITTAQNDIRAMELSIHSYFLANNGTFPPSLAAAGINKTDPWGRPYQYLQIQGSTDPNITGKSRKDKNLVPINSDFDLYSMGEDGASVSPLTAQASRDDIVRANNGAFVGLATDY